MVETMEFEKIAGDALARDYGIEGELKRLPGEWDDNFAVRIDGEDRYVLRIMHENTSPEISTFHTELLTWLSRPASPVTHLVPHVVPALDGSDSPQWRLGLGAARPVRLTTFLRGVPPREVGIDNHILGSVGRALAELHDALAGYPEDPPDIDLIFDLQNVERVIPDLTALDDASKGILEEFAISVVPRLAALPSQLLHYDFHSDNVLLDDRDHSIVVGVIDFGDVIIGPRVLDLAVCATYFFDYSSEEDARETLTALLSGYCAHRALSEQEVRLVPELIRARCALALGVTTTRAADGSLSEVQRRYILRNAEASAARMHLITDYGIERLADDLTDWLG